MIFGNAGGLGSAGPDALDFEGRRWERLFEGDYSIAKEIMARLNADDVPNRLALPPDLPTMHVVVEVMHRWIPQARKVLAAFKASERRETSTSSGRLSAAEAGLRIGDRVEYLGHDYGPNSLMPRPGERGEIFQLSPYGDAVTWDNAGSVSGFFEMRLVEEETTSE